MSCLSNGKTPSGGSIIISPINWRFIVEVVHSKCHFLFNICEFSIWRLLIIICLFLLIMQHLFSYEEDINKCQPIVLLLGKGWNNIIRELYGMLETSSLSSNNKTKTKSQFFIWKFPFGCTGVKTELWGINWTWEDVIKLYCRLVKRLSLSVFFLAEDKGA